MAYLEHTDPRRRATAVIGVGAVHALLAAAVLAGLAVTDIPRHDETLTGITLKPPPPPEKAPPPPPAPADHSTLTAPDTPLPLPAPGPEVAPYDPNDHLVPLDPLPQPTPTPTFAPQPTPSPSFALRGAMPLGNPGRWITTEDYPGRSLQRGEEGLARYRLVVASTGKVTACEIVGSSGSADLDRETCRLLAKRAQFAPASDQTGAKVVGTFSGSVRWDIPD